MNKVILSSILTALLTTTFVGCAIERSDKPAPTVVQNVTVNKEEKSPQTNQAAQNPTQNEEKVLERNHTITISALGQGVAPMNTTSPAQAYALAKRAAIADAYRIIAEKVKGVRVEGEDTVVNMMIKRSKVRTYVNACIRSASVVETTFKDGLCEVEMEITLSYSQFAQ
ncbi:MAG: LPP20 family lipoprotein [Campylobacterales bacterium]|nr:LPP20 family lipoprotein [Campylobacterales bacterium]